MAKRGQVSVAHEYDEKDQCIWCSMYRVNVERMSHVCTAEREALADSGALDAEPEEEWG